MNDWKIRQEIYHRLNTEHIDDLSDKNIEISQNVVSDAVKYFNQKDVGWIYPSKSYMVAICYAKWLSENFGGNPFDHLNDKDLLYNNDPYFIPYEKDSDTYHKILEQINEWNFCEKSGMVPDVKEYFYEEFLLKDE